jgi:circadian clock protein KaiC
MKTDGQKQANDRVRIHQIPTGVAGLDEILGGGLPEYSFNIIAGSPGSGKTTLAHQIMFANASPKRPALYFTVLGEPAIKMLRYQQQFKFFDQSKLEGSIRFVNLSQLVLEQDLGAVLEEIIKEVETSNAKTVLVDSFRTVIRKAQSGVSSEIELQGFVQRLALHLTSWQATTFLIGEYVEGEMRDNPVFTVADGLLWLYQSVERNSIVRKMQVVKMRGQESVPGLHTFRITDEGVHAFPRTYGLSEGTSHVKGPDRLSTGVPAFDKVLGGGIPEGDSVLLAGPSGSGKTVLASQFVAEGLSKGEPAVIAIFEELPAEYTRRAGTLGLDFLTPQRDGTLKIIYIRPLDLSVDETVHEVITACKELKAKRVVLDSLVGFEMALAPDFRHEFRESLYRMIVALTRLGVTIISTVEVEESFTSMGLSHYAISFLSDDIIRLRYISINGQLRKMAMVVKMRGSEHSIDMWEYTITAKGFVLGEQLRGYKGLTSGIPGPWSDQSGQNTPASRLDNAEKEKSSKDPSPLGG